MRERAKSRAGEGIRTLDVHLGKVARRLAAAWKKPPRERNAGPAWDMGGPALDIAGWEDGWGDGAAVTSLCRVTS